MKLIVSNRPYDYIESVSLTKAIELLSELEYVGADSETTGLNFLSDQILLIQLGNKNLQIVFDIQSYNYLIPQELKNFLNSGKKFIFQNAKFDLKFFYKQGVIITRLYDTLLAETIITNGMQKDGRGLKDLVEKYCKDTLDKSIRGEILSKGVTKDVIFYALKDVEFLEDIMNKQIEFATKYDLLRAINLDNSFVVVLAYIEYCGFYIDKKSWEKKCINDRIKLVDSKKILDNWVIKNYPKYVDSQLSIFDTEQKVLINWNSPAQVVKLFNEIGIKTSIIKKGKEKDTINAKELESQKNDFEIIPIYIDYKECQKVCSTYGFSWFKCIDPATNRIHTTFKQLNDTGRLSCGNKKENKPNIQNVPSDEETRHCFVSQFSNTKLINADYSGKRKKLKLLFIVILY